ncbi:four helix bundle protein [bacterium]|nr:four helix bundle protein [bacterium]
MKKTSDWVKKLGRPHENLLVWQESMEMVTMIYTLTTQFPNSERLQFISKGDLQNMVEKTKKISALLNGLIRKIKGELK